MVSHVLGYNKVEIQVKKLKREARAQLCASHLVKRHELQVKVRPLQDAFFKTVRLEVYFSIPISTICKFEPKQAPAFKNLCHKKLSTSCDLDLMIFAFTKSSIKIPFVLSVQAPKRTHFSPTR